MSHINDPTSHIAWLKARLANNRTRILGLLHRLTGLGSPSSLKPAVFAKFAHWLDEVATAKEEEMGLMSRIETIERQHRDMRKAHKLKRAIPKAVVFDDHPYCNDNARRPLAGKLLMVVWWYLILKQKINQKKQGLTVN